MTTTENDLITWPPKWFTMPPELNQLFAAATQAGEGEAGAGSAAANPALNAITAPWADFARNVTEFQQSYLKQITALWQSALPGAGEPVEDKRFAAEQWKADPRFDMVSRSYLAYSNMLHQAVEALPLDEKGKGQWSFALRHMTDALSPANFLTSNPEAMQLVVETGGKSLVDGMGLLFQDLLKGRISMTDESAFELGRNVGTTQGVVVYENPLMQLIRYTPLTPKVHQRPLLVVPPCINKYYILDLQPENSLVRYALEQGNTVFLISWHSAKPETAQLGWDDYLQQGVMQALDVALEVSGADKANALGFCLGGALLSCAHAVEKTQGKDRLASLTLLTTMLDYTDTGELGMLVTEQSVASREATIGKGGVLKGSDLALTFAALRANDLIWPYVVNSYLKGKAPPAFDLLYWNSDATNLPGPMYCWYLRNTYLENNLRKPGGTTQCGVPIDLKVIDTPAFVYASREDHIVPWQTAYESQRVLGGKTTFVLGASGHIAGVINPPAKKKRNYWTGGDTDVESEAWLDGATSVAGSWWPAWAEWLRQYGGPQVAPPDMNHPKYQPIEPAPGRYVKEKAV